MFSFAFSPRPKSLAGKLTAAVAVIVAAGLVTLGMSAPAAAVTTGSLNLTLTTYYDHNFESDPEAPVQGAQLQLWHFSQDDEQWEQVGAPVTTNSQGRLTTPITGLVVGDQYAAYIDASNAIDANNSQPVTDASGWLPQSGELTNPDFDGNVGDGDDSSVFIATPGTRDNIVELLYGLTLGGNSIDSDGNHVSAERFDIYRQQTDPNGIQSWEFYNTAITSPDGEAYSVGGLSQGNYIVKGTQSSDSAAAPVTFNDGANSFASATPIAVTYPDSSPTQDVTFVDGGTIQGGVTLNPGFNSVVGVVAQAMAFPLDANGNTDENPVEAVTADVDPDSGNYSMTVAPGKYKVEFVPTGFATDGSGETFYPSWFNNVPASEEASTIDVVGSGDDHPGIDGVIGTGYVIDGFVSADSHGRLGGIHVDAVSLTDPDNDVSTTTDDTGYYQLTLPPDYYNLSFTDPNGPYPARYYNGSEDGTNNPGLATMITATSYGSESDDFEWNTVSSLTVHLANKAGTSLSGVGVEAIPFAQGSIVPNADFIEGGIVAGHPGTYVLEGLETGMQYALYFSPPASSGSYAQFWGGSVNPEPSDLYNADGDDSSLDITLASSAAVSGVVTTTANKPIKGTTVVLWSFDGTSWTDVDSRTTSSTGAYSFTNIATGSYTVQFVTYGSPYVGTFAGGASTAAAATHVYVAQGKPATLSQHLVTGGSISGVVGGVGGNPKLPGIEVDPIALTGTPGNFTDASPYNNAFATTGSGGKFTLSGLPTGYYALTFDDFNNDTYGTPYSSPVGSPSSPTTIYHVTAGKTTTASGTIALPLLTDTQTAVVDGSLDTSMAPPIGQIAGFVDFVDADGNTAADVMIDTSGHFSANLVPGDYTYSAIFFDPVNPQNQFAQPSGSLTVTDGSNPLTLSVVDEAPLAFTTDPAIVDTSDQQVGATYQLNDPTWNHTGVDVSYQWMRCSDDNCTDPGSSDFQPIYGATGTQYTTQGADYGAAVELRVTLADDYFNAQSFADVQETAVEYALASSNVQISDALQNTSPPTTTRDLQGTASVGQVVKAQPGEWNNVPGATYSYRWIAETGTDSESPATATLGTGPTFTPTAAEADAGDSVRLWVSAKAEGYSWNPDGVSDSSSLLVIPLAGPTVKVAPKVTATHVTGGINYSVSAGTWSATGVTPVYQWVQEGAGPVSSTNSYKYTGTDDPVPAITVTVGGTKSGYTPASTTLVAQKSDANLDSSGTMTDSVAGAVTGFATAVPVGSKLSVTSPNIFFSDDSSPATTKTYQWMRMNPTTHARTAIKGATGTSYVVTSADVGFELEETGVGSNSTHLAGGFLYTAGTGALRQDLSNTPAVVTAAASNTNAPGTKITDVVSAWGTTTSVTNSYQWLICSDSDCTDATSNNFTAIPKATLNSYTPTLAQANDTLALRVIGSKSTYAPFTVYGPLTLVGNGTTISSIAKPSIASGLSSGKAIYNTKLTAKAGTWDVAGVTVAYQWQISTDGGNTWQNATTSANQLSTYVPGLGDFVAGADHIRVETTATKSGYTSATSDSAAVALAGATPVETVKPVLSTTSTGWSVTPGTWSTVASVGNVTYQWFVDNESVSDTTNTFDKSDFGVTAANQVEVIIEFSGATGYQPAFASFIAQKGAAPIWNSPTISGTPKFGNTLSIDSTVADDWTYPNANSSAFLSYQWYSNGAAISKATGSSFTPSTAYIGKTLTVKVTATSQSYATASHVTAGVLFTAGDAPHGTPSMNYGASLYSGRTVSVNLTGYTVSGLSHSYQWQISKDDSTWTNISGATKPTYVVSPSYLGEYLRVNVGSSKSGYTSTTDATGEQLIVEPAVLAPITAPSVSGNAVVGQALTVNPGSWNVTGTTFTYQWYREGIIIPGATSTSFTLTSDEFNEIVSVQVTAHAAGYDPVVFSPNSSSVDRGAAPTATVKPKITGTAKVGDTLTVSPGTWSVDGLTISYQWYYGTGSGTAIDGATSSTFTPDLLEIAQPVFCIVYVDRDGYQEGQAVSLSTATVVP